MTRFLTWNIDQFGGDLASRDELIRACAADVVMLQEVKVWHFWRLREQHHGPVIAGADFHADATAAWITAVIQLPARTTVRDSRMLTGLPRPQRAVWADVDLPDLGRVHVVSWHNENAAKDRDRKMAAFRAMSAHLAAAPHPVVVGADMNTWKDDPVLQAADPDDPFADEHAFMGLNPAHGLVDGWRTLLDRRGELDNFTTGPLATSYVLKSGAPHRFVRIWISPELAVVGGAYLYEEGRAAGSDHGLHWLDIERRL